jgi:hypothetical protein
VNNFEKKKAEVKIVNLNNSTFNVLLTFSNERQVLLYCCREENEKIIAYNIDVMAGTCPCCLKPTCSSLFAKRQELLNVAQTLTDFPKELVTVRELINS